MHNPWSLYDDLIEGIPAGITVKDVGSARWSCVITEVGAGYAMAYRSGPNESARAMAAVGSDLRDVAALAKSWDFQVASIGVAALNSWYNTLERAQAYDTYIGADYASTFELRKPELLGRRPAMIGHFPEAAELRRDYDMLVLERDPWGGDVPDTACEYLLADRDWVFITGTTLVNKSLPRLLELCGHARVSLVGPTTTFAPEVFGETVNEFGSAAVADPALVLLAARTGSGHTAAKPGTQIFNVTTDSKAAKCRPSLEVPA